LMTGKSVTNEHCRMWKSFENPKLKNRIPSCPWW
jgi:hypothetical protein